MFEDARFTNGHFLVLFGSGRGGVAMEAQYSAATARAVSLNIIDEVVNEFVYCL